MSVIEIPYTPRKHQLYLHNNLKRFNFICTHRRFGKTLFLVNQAIKVACTCTFKNPRAYIVAPFRSQVKTIAWDYAKYYSSFIPNVKINESELRIDYPNHGRLTLLGADNYNALRGIYADFVALDEYADMDPAVLPEVIMPALMDHKGSLILAGTPRGMNHFYEAYKKSLNNRDKWFVAMFKASETGIIDAKELSEIRNSMSEEQYLQEFECDFTSTNQGAYYGKQIMEAREQGRIGKVDWDDRYPVYTFWDIGVNDSTAIWFMQKVGNKVPVIDYYENSNQVLDHYIKVLASKPYTYDVNFSHWGPHDLEVKEFANGGGEIPKTRREIAKKLGVKFNLVKNIPVIDGIESARRFFRKCWFDEKKCRRGLECLENYTKSWDNKNKIWRDSPLHNWASNGADGFRYAALGIDGCYTAEDLINHYKPIDAYIRDKNIFNYWPN